MTIFICIHPPTCDKTSTQRRSFDQRIGFSQPPMTHYYVWVCVLGGWVRPGLPWGENETASYQNTHCTLWSQYPPILQNMIYCPWIYPWVVLIREGTYKDGHVSKSRFQTVFCLKKNLLQLEGQVRLGYNKRNIKWDKSLFVCHQFCKFSYEKKEVCQVFDRNDSTVRNQMLEK